MKKLIAAAGLGAAVALGSLVGAGTASAYGDETYFLVIGYSMPVASADPGQACTSTWRTPCD